MSKAIFFVTGLDSGGLENYLLRFLKYKYLYFSNIIVYCKGGKGGVLEEEFEKIPNLIIIKNAIGTSNPFDYYKLSKWLAIYKEYTICDFTGNFAGPVLWAAKKAAVKNRIVFYRSSSNRFKESKIKLKVNHFYNKLVLKYSTAILANSVYGIKFFFGDNFKDERVQIIYNGIDASKFEKDLNNLRKQFNIPKEAFVVGHTGRFNEAKNHKTIIEVARKVIKENTNVYFILCGKGVKFNLNKELNLKEKERILLFENRNDISDFLNTMDLYFFPSITEGQPNSLIEAMSLGLPFIASDIPPIKETVGDNYYSCLYNPLDNYSFAKEILKLSNTIKSKDISMKDSTRQRFNHQVLFDEFYNVI